MWPLTHSTELHVYFKLQVLFYTLTKALGQKFDIFSFPHPDLLSPEIIVVLQTVPASVILSESALLSIIYFLLCVLHLTCDYVVTHATFLSLFLIFLNPSMFASSILRSLSPKKASSYSSVQSSSVQSLSPVRLFATP